MLILDRFNSDLFGTYGVFFFNHRPVCYTLELPWRGNARNVSCIPEGSYAAHKSLSTKFGHCIRLNHVPDRDAILVHAGNTLSDTHGCILVGLDINPSGLVHSKLALSRLLETLPDGFEIKIERT